MAVVRRSTFGAIVALMMVVPVAPALAQYTSGPLVLDRFITKKSVAKKAPAPRRATAAAKQPRVAARPAAPKAASTAEEERPPRSPFGEFQVGPAGETTGLAAAGDPREVRIQTVRVRVLSPEEFNEIDQEADAPIVLAGNEFNEIDRAADQFTMRDTALSEEPTMPRPDSVTHGKSRVAISPAALGAAGAVILAGFFLFMRRPRRVRVRME